MKQQDKVALGVLAGVGALGLGIGAVYAFRGADKPDATLGRWIPVLDESGAAAGAYRRTVTSGTLTSDDPDSTRHAVELRNPAGAILAGFVLVHEPNNPGADEDWFWEVQVIRDAIGRELAAANGEIGWEGTTAAALTGIRAGLVGLGVSPWLVDPAVQAVAAGLS